MALGAFLFTMPASAQVMYSGKADPNAHSTVPADSIGAEHSWYVDLLSGNVYGPKESGQWPPVPVSNFFGGIGNLPACSTSFAAGTACINSSGFVVKMQ